MSRVAVPLLAALTVFLTLSSLAAGVARADRRSFTHTYEYATMPKGGLELETWFTQATAEFDRASPSAIQFQLEVEYGLTDHWDIALYQVFEQAADPTGMASTGLAYAGGKLESRMRLGERGEYPVDVLFYLELAKPVGVLEFEIEPKIILARDFGKMTVAANFIGELEIALERDGTENETEVKLAAFGWALGATYETMPELKLGAEFFGEFENEPAATPGGDSSFEPSILVGPTISWGPSPKLWVAANGGFGLTEDAPAFMAQAIVGLSLD